MAYIKNVMVMVLQLAFQSRRNCEQYVTVRPIVLPIIPSDSIRPTVTQALANTIRNCI